jgi:hypothetical protein
MVCFTVLIIFFHTSVGLLSSFTESLKFFFSVYLELDERCRCRRRSGCFDIFESVVESQGSEGVEHGGVGHGGRKVLWLQEWLLVWAMGLVWSLLIIIMFLYLHFIPVPDA